MTTARPRGLLLDYVGVLTPDVADSCAAFERAVGIPEGRCFDLLVADGQNDPAGGVIGALERGEIPTESFERRLRWLLDADGRVLPDGELLAGLFAQVRPSGCLWDVAAEVRAAGVPTGIVSNSWGLAMYPRDRFDEGFDVQVISGEVGLRKPDLAIFELAAARLDIPPSEAVFVDDHERNVVAARQVGMSALHHAGDDAVTASRLRSLFRI